MTADEIRRAAAAREREPGGVRTLPIRHHGAGEANGSAERNGLGFRRGSCWRSSPRTVWARWRKGMRIAAVHQAELNLVCCGVAESY